MSLELEPPVGAVAKGQSVRLFDIAVLGPSLIYIGWQQQKATYRWSLVASGVATIVYNYRNWAAYCRTSNRVKAAYAKAGMPVPDVSGDLGCELVT